VSIIAYAQFANRREVTQAGMSPSTSRPGVSTYVDALAALVPAELLTLHAAIISVTTKIDGNSTTIVALTTLRFSFWALILLGIGFYVVPRLLDRKWQPLDYIRMLIPSIAFIGWTMLQRATAFDAAFPSLPAAPRTVIALFLAVIVGAIAAALAYQAVHKEPA
jgi:hypothetical protein